MTETSIHILFVEEDVADQVSVERFVRKLSLGYKLDTVASAAQAVQRLKTSRYDVALIDYRFTDGTAFDLLQQLGETPAIFLSGTGTEELVAMALERGAYDYLIKDPGHNYLALLPGTIQKVLARKEAEQRLTATEARYRDLLETVLDLYFCVNEQGGILLINRAGAAQLGYTSSELLGQSVMALVHPGDAEGLKQHFLVAAANPTRLHPIEFRFARKDGQSMTVAADVRAQPAMGRQVPVIRILARDITARKAAAETATTLARPPRPAPPPRPVMAEAVETMRGSETLLVVDDAPEQRAVAAAMLAKLGYRVVSAENGSAALELMKQARIGEGESSRSPFDLVLLDMAMDKGPDGLETYRQILRLFPGQRCIIVTGGGQNDQVLQTQALGAGPLVSKPYTFRMIGAAVRRELDRPG